MKRSQSHPVSEMAQRWAMDRNILEVPSRSGIPAFHSWAHAGEAPSEVQRPGAVRAPAAFIPLGGLSQSRRGGGGSGRQGSVSSPPPHPHTQLLNVWLAQQLPLCARSLPWTSHLCPPRPKTDTSSPAFEVHTENTLKRNITFSAFLLSFFVFKKTGSGKTVPLFLGDPGWLS